MPYDSPLNADQINESEIDQMMTKDRDDDVFVHIGLSDIKKAFRSPPYKFIIDKLTRNYSNIMAPGFTPSFRDCGVYHKLYSKPEYGMFSKLFKEDADHRTDDAIHSILIKGEYRFPDCNHRESFGPQSCWSKFDDENMHYLNIGTKGFLTTQLHFIEVKNDLPYVCLPEHEGVIYWDETEHENIIQKNYNYDYDYWLNTYPNWPKIKSYLVERGVLSDHSIGGLRLYSFRARDIRIALEEKIADDPYYLVT